LRGLPLKGDYSPIELPNPTTQYRFRTIVSGRFNDFHERVLPDRFKNSKDLFYVPGYAQLGGEYVPHHPLLIYDVRHPTREESEGIGHPIELPHLASLIAQQDEGQAVLLDEPLVRPHEIRAYPYHLGF